jgi:hypothetical protein
MSSGEELHEYVRFTGRQRRDTSLHVLEGLLEGLAMDHVINLKEHRELRDWIISHERLVKGDTAFGQLMTTLKVAIADGILTPEEVSDLRTLCQRAKSSSPYYSGITHAIQELHGILHGLVADYVLNEQELRGLQSWLEDYHDYREVWPIGEIDSVISQVLADGKIDDPEHRLMLHYFSEFVHLSESKTIRENLPPLLPGELTITGVCAVDPEIHLEGRTFCFTGVSSKGGRRDFADIVVSKKGNFIDHIREDLDYLIIGDQGNPCWAFSCYGRKVEAAVRMRKAGHHILLVHERDFWDVLK